MSILIKGMEMPREKKTTLTIFPDGRVYENHGERLWGHGKDCIPWKAVPVPPHGRLIDETWLNMQIQTAKEIHANEKHDFCNAFDSNGHVCTEWWCVEDMIENAPTIIPADRGAE